MYYVTDILLLTHPLPFYGVNPPSEATVRGGVGTQIVIKFLNLGRIVKIYSKLIISLNLFLERSQEGKLVHYNLSYLKLFLQYFRSTCQDCEIVNLEH